MEETWVLYNGRIYTMDSAMPFATAVAIRGARIVAVGRDSEIRPLAGRGAPCVDLQGRAVVPGFIDSHTHFIAFSFKLQQVDLSGARSKEEAVARVKVWVDSIRPGEVVLGSGWDRNAWPDQSFPTRTDLDGVAPQNPVVLHSKDMHTAWVNSLALYLAGVTRETPDPPGGEIVRDPQTGLPTGILRETAQEFVYRIKASPLPEAYRSALRAGIQYAHSVGVTSVHDCEDEQALIAFERLQEAGELDLRVLMHLPVGNLEAAIRCGLRTGFGNERLRIGGVKVFVDGSLGSRSAYMLEPYSGDPHNRGIQVIDQEALLEILRRASAASISATIHAIGDAANRQALDVLEAVRAGEPVQRLRHRIEHVQIIHQDDIPRLARLNIIASMQPQHATADIDMVEAYWSGDRIRGAYAWRKLLKAGTLLAFGSDCPVEVMNPLRGIHAAVTRRRIDGYPGPEGWRPEERLTVEEAVRSFTWVGAYASGEETLKGSVTPGKLGDLAVLSPDIFKIPPMAIAEARVEATIFDGRIVFGKESLLN